MKFVLYDILQFPFSGWSFFSCGNGHPSKASSSRSIIEIGISAWFNEWQLPKALDPMQIIDEGIEIYWIELHS